MDAKSTFPKENGGINSVPDTADRFILFPGYVYTERFYVKGLMIDVPIVQ